MRFLLFVDSSCFQGIVGAAVCLAPTNPSQGFSFLTEKRAWRRCAGTTGHAVRWRNAGVPFFGVDREPNLPRARGHQNDAALAPAAAAAAAAATDDHNSRGDILLASPLARPNRDRRFYPASGSLSLVARAVLTPLLAQGCAAPAATVVVDDDHDARKGRAAVWPLT